MNVLRTTTRQSTGWLAVAMAALAFGACAEVTDLPEGAGTDDVTYDTVTQAAFTVPTGGADSTGLLGMYYNEMDFTQHVFSRADANVSFYWGSAAPDPRMGADTFSVRWVGQINVPDTATYWFEIGSDDGSRLYIDGELIADNWGNHGHRRRTGSVDLTAGEPVFFEMQMYENGGGASMELKYSLSSGGTYGFVPTGWFSNHGNGTGLYAQWWNTRASMEAAEEPVVESVKTTPVFFPPGYTSLPEEFGVAGDPPPGVAADQWAARLTGYLEPPVDGDYTFGVDCGDSPFLFMLDVSFLAGQDPIVLDQWDAPDGSVHTLSAVLSAGQRIPVRFEVEDEAGASACRMGWQRPDVASDRADFEYIPPEFWYPARFGTGSGLTGHYHDNVDFTNLFSSQIDEVVNFDWGTGSPVTDNGITMGADNFSIEWRGEIEATYPELYKFSMNHDNSIRLWVNNVLIVDRWTNSSGTAVGEVDFRPESLCAGLAADETCDLRVPIRIQYREYTDRANIAMSWSSPSQRTQIVPSSQLYPEQPDPSSGSGLQGEYFNSVGFADFFRTRNDSVVNFNWGSASPFPGTTFGADTFSVRWSGQVRPRYTETYTFSAFADDEVSIWVNDEQLLARPNYSSAMSSGTAIDLLAGKRYDIRMEVIEHGGGAMARLLWSSPSQAEEVVPTSRLFLPPNLGTGDGLLGEYYGDSNLDERDLRMVRVDATIDFQEVPNEVLPPRNHGARWRGSFESIYDEPYELIIRTNGGARLLFDDVVVLDELTDPGATIVEHRVSVDVEPGLLYDLVLEYSQTDDDVASVIELDWESFSQVRASLPMRQMYSAEPSANVELGECESVIEISNWDPDGTGLPDGLEADGGLTLTGDVVRQPDLWVANQDYTMTRIDTALGTVTGTYPVGAGASRTAVDLDYNAWVANRWGAGTINKILHDCECPDATTLCTECVALTVSIGENSVPRGLAIDANNDVWVGSWNQKRIYKINNNVSLHGGYVGQILGSWSIPVNPYGIAIDGQGKIWIAQINNGIGCFDTITEEPCGSFTRSGGVSWSSTSDTTCLSPYGISVDAAGNVWWGNWSCNGLGRLDRASYDASVVANTDSLNGSIAYANVVAEMEVFQSTTTNLGRGVAVDGEGMVWMAASGSGRLNQFNPETEEFVGAYAAGTNPIGVGITDEGHAVAVAYASNRVYAYDSSGVQQWRANTGSNPYSYSDMTGFQLRNFTAPQGVWNQVFDCNAIDPENGCVFDYLTWDATTPRDASVQVRVRTGVDNPDGSIDWGDWSAQYTTQPAPLGREGYEGRYVEVEITLFSSPRGDAPVVRAAELWRCPQVYVPENFELDDRWIVNQDDRNYAISWQLEDDSWPETRWEFLDSDGHRRCTLDSDTSITKGQVYSGEAPFPACVEEWHVSNVPIERSVRTAYQNPDTGEWIRSLESDPHTYYTLTNNPTADNGDMRIVNQTEDTIWINWCRPENNWSAGITGARLSRYTTDPSAAVILADFSTDPTAAGTDRGYASDSFTCGTLADDGLTAGVVYTYMLEYQNGDGIRSQPMIVSQETYGRPCCDELPEGCTGVCAMAVTGPDGCEYPGLHEDPEVTCDDLDNDCDGDIDEGVLNLCGYCGPAPVEVCDGVDNDCNGIIDTDAVDGPTRYLDRDGDGYGDPSTAAIVCVDGPEWVSNDLDCDDTNAAINPGAEEVCDGVDNDCNGEIDETGGFITYYSDGDGDGYGDNGDTVEACVIPTGFTTDNTDCDDSLSSVYPGAPETCNGIDDDCDGAIDNGWANVEVDVVTVRSTAHYGPEWVGAGNCMNDDFEDEFVCEGIMVVEFMVTNPSAYDVPTEVTVDFRIDDAAGPRITTVKPLNVPVDAGTSETYYACFGSSYDGLADMWVGLNNASDHMPLCAPVQTVNADTDFTGGDEICDGNDNNCDGLVDNNACGAVEVCVNDPGTASDWICVAAMTEEGACEGADCIVSCEYDSDCELDGAQCLNGLCVDMRWAEVEDDTAAPAAEVNAAPRDGAVEAETSLGSQEPGEAGCSSVPGRRSTSVGWAGMLLALTLVRRRRCRDACRA